MNAQLGIWLKKPESMGAEAIEQLPRIIEKYPYCATFRLLYTIALSNTHSIRLNDELRITATSLPDRMKLFQLVNNGEHEWVSLLQQFEQMRKKELAAPCETDDFTLIDQYLSQQYLPDADLSGLLPETNVTEFSMSELEKLPDADVSLDDEGLIVNPEKNKETSADQLIDQFLEADSNGELFVPQPDLPAAEIPVAEPEKIHEKAFLTESLAKLYVKQHKFEQALAIFSSLNLKYSKNSSNFADQIRYLEKVIAYRKEMESTDIGKQNK
jgi:hypothetical protein